MKKIKTIIQLLIVVMLLGSLNIAYAKDDIMPLAEVQQGMVGIANTVITGTTMEEIRVEVLGIVAGNGSSVGDMILVRTSGSVIERTGGVAQGMSGSPVYINGRLVGAIARGWALSDQRIAMVTPIESMLKIFASMERQETVDRENRDRENALRLEQVRKRVAEERQKDSQKAIIVKDAKANIEGKADVVDDELATNNEPVENQESKTVLVKENESENAKETTEKNDNTTSDSQQVTATTQDKIAEEKNDNKNSANNQVTETAQENVVEEKKDESIKVETEQVEEKTTEKTTEKTIVEQVEKTTQEPTEQKEPNQEVVNKSTPLSVSGFTANSLAFLTEKLKTHNMQPYTADLGGNVVSGTDTVLQGGSPVALLLTTGDVSMGASGTVTMVEDDKVLAFGHEFMRRGDVDYFMAEAIPLTVLPSINSGQRITNIGKVIGTFKQDRTNGLAGIIGKMPVAIPIRITLKDTTTGKKNNVYVRMVRDEILVPLISEAVLFNSIDVLTDRIGHGTAKVSINVTGDLPDNKEISRSNMYYSPTSVATLATAELGVAMDMLMNNRFQKINVNTISVDVEVTGEALVNKIISASSKTTKAKPGDKIAIEITSSTYRGENIVEKIEYMIPRDYKEEKANLLIRGGASIAWVQALLEQQQKEQGLSKRDIDKNKTLTQYIDEFNKMDSNNVVVVDILPTPSKLTQKQLEKMSREMSESVMSQQPNIPSLIFGSQYKKNYPVNYIVNGDTRLTIEIEQEKI